MITGVDFVWLPVSDMARARKFYEGTLGLPPAVVSASGWAEYELGDGPAIVLADLTTPSEAMQAGKAASVGLAVHDFEPTTEAVRALDLLHMDPFETDTCHGGPMSDSEDNSLILHQRKAEPERDRVVDFVVLPVEDMARARAFYEGTLGLTLDSEGRGIWAEYVLSDDSALALFQGPDFEPAGGGGVGLRTPNLEQVFERLKGLGFARAESLVETPVCRLGLVRDSEGNALVLHRHK
jgi:catechol 2,3-dioxygenase-like lactoylglutathione lyase family enzyme